MPLASDPPQLSAPPKAFTVAEVVSRIRALIDQQFPSAIWVEGELSNCSHPSSGHLYFDLVDERATDRRGQRLLLPCAFFRNANQSLKFRLEDGMKVLCLGEITTYEAKGQYQLRVLQVQPKGIGALQLAFEQLKKRLAAEGLFDEARKRPIPMLPERVGIVTSTTGSAIHDLLARLRGRFHLMIFPVKVQGEGAAEEIAEAIRLANRNRLADVLIVGRGGGSLEDLWAFNEEVVARMIFASEIPVLSAVGHEDYWAMSDYVADVRASTPTHAAQLLIEGQERCLAALDEVVDRLIETMRASVDDQEQGLSSLCERLRLLHPLRQVEVSLERARQLKAQLFQVTRHVLEQADRQLQGLAGRLHALSPLAVLARGYSVTFTLPARRVVTDARTLQAGDALETRLAHGGVVSTVTQTTQ